MTGTWRVWFLLGFVSGIAGEVCKDLMSEYWLGSYLVCFLVTSYAGDDKETCVKPGYLCTNMRTNMMTQKNYEIQHNYLQIDSDTVK